MQARSGRRHRPRKSDFYIPATGPPREPRRARSSTATRFTMFDSHGDIGATRRRSGRALPCRYALPVAPANCCSTACSSLLLGSNVRDDNAVLTVDLTNPDIYFDAEASCCRRTRCTSCERVFLWQDTAYRAAAASRITATAQSAAIVDSAFAAISPTCSRSAASGGQRRGRARPRSTAAVRSCSAITGSTSTARTHRTDLRSAADRACRPASRRMTSSWSPASAPLVLRGECLRRRARAGSRTPFRRACCGMRASADAPRQRAQPRSRHRTSSSTSAVPLDRRSRHADDRDRAGPLSLCRHPLVSTTFGRDGIITAMQMLWSTRRSPRGVLRYLAAYQATDFDPLADAEPGKILHEMRARRDGGSGRGAVRPLLRQRRFHAALRHARRALFRAHRRPRHDARRSGRTSRRRCAGSTDPATATATASSNITAQTERALPTRAGRIRTTSIFHADGRLAQGPIALCEVQGYVFAAKRMPPGVARRARLREHGGRARRAGRDALRERFEDAFWCEEIGTYALALDGSKQPCRVRTSNAGHVLVHRHRRASDARRCVASA